MKVPQMSGQAEVRPRGFALAPQDEGMELCTGGRERRECNALHMWTGPPLNQKLCILSSFQLHSPQPLFCVLSCVPLRNVRDHKVVSFQIQSHLSVTVPSQ